MYEKMACAAHHVLVLGSLIKETINYMMKKLLAIFYENPAIMCITFCVDTVTVDNEQIFQMF